MVFYFTYIKHIIQKQATPFKGKTKGSAGNGDNVTSGLLVILFLDLGEKVSSSIVMISLFSLYTALQEKHLKQ